MMNCKQILEVGFHASYNEVMDILENLEKDLRAFTGDYIKKLFKDINTNLMRRFNKEFSKDENGQPRNWIMIEEPKIRELHLKCKQNVETLFSQFKYINIPHQIASGIIGTPGHSDSMDMSGYTPGMPLEE